jgi:O-acetyl-ADP-ribose deacetylase (regulator of RNase III)
VIGDATQPRGTGFRLLVHIVNDKTPNWGAGFAAAVKNKWPLAQEDFQHWAHSGQNRLKLGNVHFSKLETNLAICHMVSQRGYGQSSKPRIRYDALADCLESAGDYALSHNATVHMPRIGTGQAGGSWNIVEELIKEVLCRRDIEVNVYDLRNAKLKIQPAQQQLFDLR